MMDNDKKANEPLLKHIEDVFTSAVHDFTKYDVVRGDGDNLFWCVRRDMDASDERTVTVQFSKRGSIDSLNFCMCSNTGLEDIGTYIDNPEDLAELFKLIKVVKVFMKDGD